MVASAAPRQSERKVLNLGGIIEMSQEMRCTVFAHDSLYDLYLLLASYTAFVHSAAMCDEADTCHQACNALR